MGTRAVGDQIYLSDDNAFYDGGAPATVVYVVGERGVARGAAGAYAVCELRDGYVLGEYLSRDEAIAACGTAEAR